MKEDLLQKRKKKKVLIKKVLQKRKREVMKRKTLLRPVMMNEASCSPLATFVLKRGSSSSSSIVFVSVCFVLSCTLINAPPPPD